jgi:hypothetical protein
MTLPTFIAHADWSINPDKCHVAVAQLMTDRTYRAVSLGPAQPLSMVQGDLRTGLNVAGLGPGQLWAGFDLPIGLPRAYAEKVGVVFWPDFLALLGHEPWHQFADVAASAVEVSLHRPFYPARPGGAQRSDLYEALGLTRPQVRRRCDGNDAESMFWTLGGKQIGKAALAGWTYLSAVPADALRLWPFQGPLTKLLDGDPGVVVVSETYPREFYQYFRRSFNGRGSKRNVEDRLEWMPDLLRWSDALEVNWQGDVQERVEAGFSAESHGEDEFDAVVGLLGMISVIMGAVDSGEPEDDPAVTNIEGWILGRSSDPAGSMSRQTTTEAAWSSLAVVSSEEQRASIEATLRRLIEFARDLGYRDDEVTALLERCLSEEPLTVHV